MSKRRSLPLVAARSCTSESEWTTAGEACPLQPCAQPPPICANASDGDARARFSESNCLHVTCVPCSHIASKGLMLSHAGWCWPYPPQQSVSPSTSPWSTFLFVVLHELGSCSPVSNLTKRVGDSTIKQIMALMEGFGVGPSPAAWLRHASLRGKSHQTPCVWEANADRPRVLKS